MKIFILLKILIILSNFKNFLFAGAPPLNKEMLPEAPYEFIKTNHIIIGVEWKKSSLTDVLPSKLTGVSTITGGINIFNSRKKQSFSPLSGAYGWVDLPGGDKKEKFIIFSMYGPNAIINKVMKSVYSLKSEIGSNKVTLINNKAVATSSINGKNVLIFSGLNSENCIKASGQELLVSSLSDDGKVYKKFNWTTKNQCNISPDQIELKEVLKKFEIKKMIWAKTLENSNVIIEKPVSYK